MHQQRISSESELIKELAAALQAYIDSSPDHFAAEEAKNMIKELQYNPELTVEKISQAFNGPKTVITDSLGSTTVRKTQENVELARKTLGNFYAIRRLSARARS